MAQPVLVDVDEPRLRGVPRRVEAHEGLASDLETVRGDPFRGAAHDVGIVAADVRQALGGTKCEAEIEALRAAIIKAELARAQAENHLLRQRVLDLEKALVRRESAVKSSQTKAASEVARLKEKNKELQLKLRHMWDWHNNEITKAGGLTFKQAV